MKKTVLNIMLLCMSLLLAVSCNFNDPAKENLVNVKLIATIPEEKGGVTPVYAGDYGSVEIYKYKATPQFASEAKGKTDYTTIELDDNDSVTLNGFAQGYWEFTVQAYNHNLGLMYEGTTKTYLTGTLQSVAIVLTPKYDASAGLDNNVTFNVEAPLVGNSPSFEYVIKDSSGNNVSVEGLTLSTKDSKHVLTGSLTLVPGTYVITFVNKDGSTVVGGQAVGLKVIGKTAVSVEGSVNNGIYVDATLSVTTQFFSGKVKYKKDSTTILEFVPDTGSLTPDSYAWYVNGVESGTESSYEFSGEKSGLYCITCVAFCSTITPNEVTSDSFIFEYTAKDEE